MGTAVKTIFADKCLRIFVPFALIVNLLGAGPLTLALPFCMEKGFTVDMYGYIISIYTVGALVGILLLGILKLKPVTRFWVMALGFSCSVVFFILTWLGRSFGAVCVFAFLAACLNSIGNSVFNASLMLALPEENRGAILGFVQSCSTGGSAVSAVLYGLLGDVFPLYLVFTVGTAISLAPMLYLCFHPETKRFIKEH